MPPLVHMLQRRTWRFLGAALGLLLAATAACGPGEPEHLGASSHVHRSSNPAWRVAPSVEQEIFRSTTIVRATLQSATAAVETLPSEPGVASTYQAVQELRFTVHEYLKGSGPTALLVVVRGADGYPTEAAARADAAIAVQLRVSIWDERQAVLFLEAPSRPYTPASASGGATGTSGTTAPAVLQFTRLNNNESPWAYSVDTLSRAWLPAEDIPAEGGTPTAFITDGGPTPPPTITLADLRARIAALAAELEAGEGIDGYAACIYGRILRERYNRADPWTPPLIEAALASGISTGAEVYEQEHDGPQYHRYWLSGPDAALFQPAIVDDDGQASTGYDYVLTAARPLAAGEYDVFYNSQHYSRFSCAFVPVDAYLAVTVTVTAPTGTVHEALFDPAAMGSGVVGRDTAQGVLSPAAVGSASGAAGAAASTTSATLRRLTWDAGQLRLDVSGTTLAGQQLELIRLDGTVGLTLRGDAATATTTAGGHELRWSVCTQPWQPGERLLLRISPAPAGRPAGGPGLPRRPRPAHGDGQSRGPHGRCIRDADGDGARRRGHGHLPVATRRGRGVDAGGGRGRHLPGARPDRPNRDLAGAGPLRVGDPGPLGPGHADLAGGGHVPVQQRGHGAQPHNQYGPGAGLHGAAAGARRAGRAGPPELDGTRALSDWTGVTVGGTPQRVVGLRLDALGLTGLVPAALGELTQLTTLDLRGNALTGAVPDALGALTRLTELQLVGTRLTGCLPAALAGVGTTDAAAQGLAACQAGPVFGAARYAWIVPAGLPVGAAVGQVQATDPGGGAVTYALTAGTHAGVFKLDATTGILSVAGALPAGGAGLTVTATDSQGGATRVPVVVAVADAAQQRAPPVFPAAGWSFRVAEDAPVGTPVGTAAALDLDGGPLTYALTAGNTGGVFALDASSGMLTVAGALDYETTASYALTLTASDAHGGTATATVAISVTDVAYAPSFAAAPLTFTVDETAAVGTAVGVVQALDPAGGAVTYALTAGNAAGGLCHRRRDGDADGVRGAGPRHDAGLRADGDRQHHRGRDGNGHGHDHGDRVRDGLRRGRRRVDRGGGPGAAQRDPLGPGRGRGRQRRRLCHGVPGRAGGHGLSGGWLHGVRVDGGPGPGHGRQRDGGRGGRVLARGGGLGADWPRYRPVHRGVRRQRVHHRQPIHRSRRHEPSRSLRPHAVAEHDPPRGAAGSGRDGRL